MIDSDSDKILLALFNSFPELTKGDLELLFENAHEMTFNPGETIYKESGITSNVYFLNNGLVKLLREHKHNRTIILSIVPESRFVGLVSLFGSKVYDSSAQSIGKTKVLTIHEEAFRKVMLRNSDFSMKIVEKLSSEGLHVLNHLVDVTQKQLPGRVADILLYFYSLHGSTTFQLPITRRELAEFAGTSKESFIRTLSEFKLDKIITVPDKKTIVIESLEILKKLSKYG